MEKCPHCGSETIAPASRFYSSLLFPVACPNCGGLAGVRGTFAGSYAAIVEFLILAMFLILAGNSPTLNGTLILLAFSGFNLILGLANSLQPLTKAQTKFARKLVLILLPFFIVTVVVGGSRG